MATAAVRLSMDTYALQYALTLSRQAWHFSVANPWYLCHVTLQDMYVCMCSSHMLMMWLPQLRW